MTHLMFQQNFTRLPSLNGCILVGPAATRTLNQPGNLRALRKQSQTRPKPMGLPHLPSPLSEAIFTGHIHTLTQTLPALLRPLHPFNPPRLVPESDDGNVEYKLQLLSPSPLASPASSHNLHGGSSKAAVKPTMN